MKVINAQQSAIVSGGNMGAALTGAIVMGVMPLIGTYRTLNDYVSMGLVCGALLSPNFVNNKMPPALAYSTVVVVTLIGVTAGTLQGLVVEGYHIYSALAKQANQTAV